MITEGEIRAYLEEHREETIRLLEELGKIPAPSHKEEKRAAFCKAWLEKNGCGPVRIDDAKNVICMFQCDRFEDMAVFMAHTDVVFEDEEELPMSREGNILKAPGIGDDTANVVNLMMAARFMAEHQEEMSMGFLIVANACEEGLGNLKGCKEIFHQYGDRIRAFYSFDGYMPECTSIPVGSHRYQIRVSAEGGHSYGDFGRDNAIAVAAELIHSLYQIEPPQEEYTTYNVGRIEGGTTVNSIAQEAVFLYEYRSSSEECLKIMRKKMMQVIDSFLENGKRIEAELLGIRPGIGPFEGKTLQEWTKRNIAVLSACCREEVKLCEGSTDANIPLSLGILANTIGTVRGGGAHTREEWVDLDSLQTGTEIVIRMMQLYLK